jgi:hypothetical protein
MLPMLPAILLTGVLSINTPVIPTNTGPTNPGVPGNVEPVLLTSSNSTDSSDSREEDDSKRGSGRRD